MANTSCPREQPTETLFPCTQQWQCDVDESRPDERSPALAEKVIFGGMPDVINDGEKWAGWKNKNDDKREKKTLNLEKFGSNKK